jgi:hypothetical protein
MADSQVAGVDPGRIEIGDAMRAQPDAADPNVPVAVGILR